MTAERPQGFSMTADGERDATQEDASTSYGFPRFRVSADSADFQAEITFLGMTASPAFIRQSEGTAASNASSAP